MSGDDFPADVEQFITEHISSVGQLEVLLLLRQNSSESWDAAAVSAALRTAPEMAAAQLALLHAQGMIRLEDEAAGRYRYSADGSKLAGLIDRLAEVYEERRVAVITLIYSKPVDKVRTFADAFRLRKDK